MIDRKVGCNLAEAPIRQAIGGIVDLNIVRRIQLPS